MQKDLKLSFFWHMHQPDYRDSTGVMKMPWVFLHAIKDYYEMPWILSLYPSLKATFNITPPLIEQLNLYSEPTKNDYFLDLWLQHPSKLEASEREWLIKTCKSSNFDTMVKPLSTYATLFHQEYLDDKEMIDLEVLFILSWSGIYLRQNNKSVKRLLQKANGFTQKDKQSLLDELAAFVLEILPFYGKLAKEGVISLSTTPYNHPILPLLFDMDNAHKANEHAALPDNPLCLADDAIEQVDRSIALYKETFGLAPTGFWPAEGAVDERSVELYSKLGLKWIATDEAILFRSLGSDDRTALYSSYKYKDVTIGFRDHGISDLLGFTYRFKSPHEAAEHFVNTIEPLAEDPETQTLFVILDGENAWEFFEENAFPFFTGLYERLSELEWCDTVTMDEVAAADSKELEQLAPGSWIGGDFSTWSGHAEKNRAWELIYQTKRDVEHYNHPISDEIAKKIQFHFLASECSDWFWWYGDDHVTDFALEFDALFRNHLITIYQLLDIYPPADLLIPIISNKSTASFMVKPQSAITPDIDGKHSNFFDWIGSGSIDESRLFSTMDRVRGPIEKIYYGHDKEHVFIAFEGDIESLKDNDVTLQIIIEETEEDYSVVIGEENPECQVKCVVADGIELAIPFSLFEGNTRIHLRFEFEEKNTILQTLPGYGALEIDIDEDYTKNWFV